MMLKESFQGISRENISIYIVYWVQNHRLFTNGKILFEDFEYLYHIDRMMYNKNAMGILKM